MNIENYTVAELKELAKEKGLKNISKLNKDELFELLNEENKVEETKAFNNSVDILKKYIAQL